MKFILLIALPILTYAGPLNANYGKDELLAGPPPFPHYGPPSGYHYIKGERADCPEVTVPECDPTQFAAICPGPVDANGCATDPKCVVAIADCPALMN